MKTIKKLEQKIEKLNDKKIKIKDKLEVYKDKEFLFRDVLFTNILLPFIPAIIFILVFQFIKTPFMAYMTILSTICGVTFEIFLQEQLSLLSEKILVVRTNNLHKKYRKLIEKIEELKTEYQTKILKNENQRSIQELGKEIQNTTELEKTETKTQLVKPNLISKLTNSLNVTSDNDEICDECYPKQESIEEDRNCDNCVNN